LYCCCWYQEGQVTLHRNAGGDAVPPGGPRQLCDQVMVMLQDQCCFHHVRNRTTFLSMTRIRLRARRVRVRAVKTSISISTSIGGRRIHTSQLLQVRTCT
jgi:hypothetical protein